MEVEVSERLLVILETAIHLLLVTVISDHHAIGLDRIHMLVWNAFEG